MFFVQLCTYYYTAGADFKRTHDAREVYVLHNYHTEFQVVELTSAAFSRHATAVAKGSYDKYACSEWYICYIVRKVQYYNIIGLKCLITHSANRVSMVNVGMRIFFEKHKIAKLFDSTRWRSYLIPEDILWGPRPKYATIRGYWTKPIYVGPFIHLHVKKDGSKTYYICIKIFYNTRLP